MFPTVIALSAAPGDLIVQVSGPRFPAATTTVGPGRARSRDRRRDERPVAVVVVGLGPAVHEVLPADHLALEIRVASVDPGVENRDDDVLLRVGGLFLVEIAVEVGDLLTCCRD